MATNEEVLGPRKTMIVLVIVVGCFAVLWPRILSPLMLGPSPALEPNQFDRDAALKQERPPIRGLGPHPALRERGRAIPANAPTPPSRVPVPLPPHIRVRQSPLSGYFDIEIKPPPIPGMRPPLGSPGGPVQPPKSSMGFVMPIYTICIIVFFVYTLSKILFKRTGSPYESISPDPQFRRRVFRDDSRASPEPKLVVTAISGLVAEVRQQMEAGYAHNQQRQDVQDNHTRPYKNGTLGNDTVRIIATEYKEAIPELKEPTPEPLDRIPVKELSPEPKELNHDKENTPETIELSPEKDESPVREEDTREETPKELSPEPREPTPEKELTPELKELTSEPKELVSKEDVNDKQVTDEFLSKARADRKAEDKQTTPELLEEALREMGEEEDEEEIEEELEEEEEAEPEKSTVRVLGMETTAHAADGGAWPSDERHVAPVASRPAHSPEDVKSIFLETEIPQQSKVLVADFAEHRADSPAPAKNASLIVSGKMTLSLIQDAPRGTPDRDLESTMDEFTTASAVTQPAAEDKEDLSEEEIEEEIEIEEIEEEIEEDDEEQVKQK